MRDTLGVLLAGGAGERLFLITPAGAHIDKMNDALMLHHHRDSGADVTLATPAVAPTEVAAFGVVEVARNGEVTGFEEKPKEAKIRSPFNPDMVDVSMGVYIFNTDVLLPELIRDAEDPHSKHDSVHNILPDI